LRFEERSAYGLRRKNNGTRYKVQGARYIMRSEFSVQERAQGSRREEKELMNIDHWTFDVRRSICSLVRPGGVSYEGSGSGFRGSGFWVQRFRVQGSEVQGSRFRVKGSGFWVLNFTYEPRTVNRNINS
jgi:hypothetical protein